MTKTVFSKVWIVVAKNFSNEKPAMLRNFKHGKITKINSDKNAICENSFESKVEFLNSFA